MRILRNSLLNWIINPFLERGEEDSFLLQEDGDFLLQENGDRITI